MPEFDFKYTDIIDSIKLIEYAAHEGVYRGIEVMRSVVAHVDKLQRFVAAAEAAMLRGQAEAAAKAATANANETTQITKKSSNTRKKTSGRNSPEYRTL